MCWDVTRAKYGMSCDKEELVLGKALGFNLLISFLYSVGNNKGVKGLFQFILHVWKMSYVFTDSGTRRVWMALLPSTLANILPLFQCFLSLYILHC